MRREPPAPASISSVVLAAGEFYFGGGTTRISTLLGSCVSITLWHPRKHIGGMCHYMMTARKNEGIAQPERTAKLDGRYADEAFKLFLQGVEQAGTRPAEYQAKLFGGADMFGTAKGSPMNIGERNIAFGRDLLSHHGITLIAEHIGGSGRRKLHFDLWSGDVWLAFPEGVGAEIRGSRG